jgi:hypothetical protein
MITFGPKSGAHGSTAGGGAASAGPVVAATAPSAKTAVTIKATRRGMRRARR